MKMTGFPFSPVDWSTVEAATQPGETGSVTQRVRHFGDIRVRMVEYSAGYLADHWCDKGHVIFVVKGELVTELKDGRSVTLTPGMSYQVADHGDAPHRSRTRVGATLFIVD